MRRLAVASLLFVAACDPTTEDADASPLRITQSNPAVITGSFVHAGSIVVFESRMVEPEHVALRLELDGAVIAVDADFALDLFTTNGGGAALYAEDLATLVALRDALRVGLPADALAALHGRVLVRHADRLGEAPPGLTLGFQVTDLQAAPTAGFWCGDEGVTCLAGTCGTDWQCHDAGSHACDCWDAQYGNCTTDCRGRCGAGCNPFDNEFTWDCFDHDKCLDYHGGSIWGDNPDCGDEFWEADDDYWATYGSVC